jgi:nitrogen fixation protein FixH
MNKNQTLWPFAIIGAFALFISGTVCLIVLACTHGSDLVSANYYEQELKFQEHIDRVHRTEVMAASAKVAYNADNATITLSLPTPQIAGATAGHIQLYRPSSVGLDRDVKLNVDRSGIQSVDASGLEPGLWRVRVSWTAEEREYYTEQQLVVKNVKQLLGGGT